MKENLLKFGIKVLAISAILFAIWSLGGREYYLSFMRSSSIFLLKIFTTKLHRFGSPSYGFAMLIPFLSLALATRTVSFKGKLYKILMGIGVIIAWNWLLIFVWYFLHQKVGQTDTVSVQQRSTLFFLSGILPFVLWAVLFRDNIKKLFYPKKRKPARAAA